MLSTKELYMKACLQSEELHQMTEEERSSLQAHLRKMYQEVEKVCNRHGLNIMVAYGSALGATRHQGFIPWDDDMDLFMPRADYDKLVNKYANELPDSYKIFAPNSKNGPIYRFGKIVDTKTRFLTPCSHDDESHGIFLDIFILENTPTNMLHVQIRRFIAIMLMLISSCVQEKNTGTALYKNIMCSTKEGKRTYNLRMTIGFLFSFLNEKSWFKLFDRVANYNKTTGYVSVPSAGPKLKWFTPTPMDFFFPTQRVKFDDIEVNIPNQTIKHLENEYGDWQRVPKENERWQHFIKEIQL